MNAIKLNQESKRELPSPEFMRECFSYDPESGAVAWKERPFNHFKSPNAARSFNTRYAGKTVGSPSHGYLRISMLILGVQRSFYAHRIAWCVHFGEWPDLLIDHKDLNGTNNALCNLRPASVEQNIRNCGARRHNKLGIKGAQKTPIGKYQSRISVNGRQRYLGTFESAEEASNAYLAAAKEICGEFSRVSREAA